MLNASWVSESWLKEHGCAGEKFGDVPIPFVRTPADCEPPMSQDPGHRQPRVVVQDAPGHAAQERERRDVTVAERLGRLCGVGFDEACQRISRLC